MSSVQERRLEFSYEDATTYFEVETGSTVSLPYNLLGINSLAGATQTSFQYIVLTDTAKSILFPNEIAHPLSLSYRIGVSHPLWGAFQSGIASCSINIDSTELATYDTPNETFSTVVTIGEQTDATNATITNSNKNSIYKLGVKRKSGGSSGSNALLCVEDEYVYFISLKFNRYDFSAIAGTGISSATATSTGYDGDTITYSCNLSSGYTFDGWYNGSTKVSSSQTYDHIVNGSDLSLTAKATQSSRALKVYYKNQELVSAGQSVSWDVNVTYKGSTLTTVALGSSKTLNCNGKFMQDNVTIGSKKLNCKGNIMESDILITIT